MSQGPGQADSTPYLDYYKSIGRVPVHQHVEDLDLHFRRRAALYRQLGVLPVCISNRRVIEFGPGSGDNALYIAHLKPLQYVLVDGYSGSCEAVREKLELGRYGQVPIEVVHSNICAYEDARRYDVVLCEGVLFGQRDLPAFLCRVAAFVNDGGLLVITTNNYTSIFAEVCRRAVKPVFAQKCESHDTLLHRLVEFFRPHLATLKGMSRLPEDWVFDNILHPWEDHTHLSIPDACQLIGSQFEFLSSSPRFVRDWRWYKSIPHDSEDENARVLQAYQQISQYFLDYRESPGERVNVELAGLEDACHDAFRAHLDAWYGDHVERIPTFLSAVEAVRTLIADVFPRTAQSIADYLSGMEKLLGGSDRAPMGDFESFFGRGQQYASFSRRGNGT